MTHPTHAELVEAMARAMATHFSMNRMPHMSGDPLARLGSQERRRLDDATQAALTTLCTLITGLPALLDGTARVVPVKLLTEAHACMRATGWQLAPACDDGSDGVLNAAVAEIEAQFAATLAEGEPT